MRLNVSTSSSLIHNKQPSVVDNVLKHTLFCKDFMGLPGSDTLTSIPHNFLNRLTLLLSTTRLITSFRKQGGDLTGKQQQ